MKWNEVLGLFLLGGFVVFLIAAGRLDSYLSLFASSGPVYGGGGSTSSPNSGGGLLPYLPNFAQPGGPLFNEKGQPRIFGN